MRLTHSAVHWYSAGTRCGKSAEKVRRSIVPDRVNCTRCLTKLAVSKSGIKRAKKQLREEKRTQSHKEALL